MDINTETFKLSGKNYRMSEAGKIEKMVAFNPFSDGEGIKAWIPVKGDELKEAANTEPALTLPEDWPKISYLDHRFVMEYFAFVYKIHKSEAIVLFHLDLRTKEYTVIIPPEVDASAGHVKYNAAVTHFCSVCRIGSTFAVETCPYCVTKGSMEEFCFAGSAHSHGSMAAFHSSTDDEHELGHTGFHITYGKVDSEEETKPSFVVALPGTTEGGKGTRFLPEFHELVEDPFASEREMMNLWVSMIVSKPSLDRLPVDGHVLAQKSKSKVILYGTWLTLDTLKRVQAVYNLSLPQGSTDRWEVLTKTEAAALVTPKKQSVYGTSGKSSSSPQTNTTRSYFSTSVKSDLKNIGLGTKYVSTSLPGAEKVGAHVRTDDVGRSRLFKDQNQAEFLSWGMNIPGLSSLSGSWGTKTKLASISIIGYLFDEMASPFGLLDKKVNPFFTEVIQVVTDFMDSMAYKNFSDKDAKAYLTTDNNAQYGSSKKESSEEALTRLVAKLTPYGLPGGAEAAETDRDCVVGSLIFCYVLKDFLDYVVDNWKMPVAIYEANAKPVLDLISTIVDVLKEKPEVTKA